MDDAIDSRFDDLAQRLLEKSLGGISEGDEALDAVSARTIVDSYISDLTQEVSKDPGFDGYFGPGDQDLPIDETRPSSVSFASLVKDPVVFTVPSKGRTFTIKAGVSISGLPEITGGSQTFGHAEKEHKWVLAGVKGFVTFITSGPGSKVVFLSFTKGFGSVAGHGTGTWD